MIELIFCWVLVMWIWLGMKELIDWHGKNITEKKA
jgi:hypothetical protein